LAECNLHNSRGGGGTWFIPDLWELTKERYLECRYSTVYGRVAPQHTLKIIKNNHFSKQSGKPKKIFQSGQEANLQLVEFEQLLIAEM